MRRNSEEEPDSEREPVLFSVALEVFTRPRRVKRDSSVCDEGGSRTCSGGPVRTALAL